MRDPGNEVGDQIDDEASLLWGNIVNKQLFLSEIVFRFRKDIGSPRRPGFVIYSP